MKNVTKDDVFNFFKTGEKFIGKFAIDVYGKVLNEVGEQAFSSAIEIGIENTFATLYDAKVEDRDILRVVCDHWGIAMEDAEERLVWTKQQAAIFSLKQYLKLQGYTENEIKSFMIEHEASIKIRHDKDLWKLKNNPEKLFKVIISSNERDKR